MTCTDGSNDDESIELIPFLFVYVCPSHHHSTYLYRWVVAIGKISVNTSPPSRVRGRTKSLPGAFRYSSLPTTACTLETSSESGLLEAAAPAAAEEGEMVVMNSLEASRYSVIEVGR